MVDPTPFTAWGPLGAILFLVVMFGVYLTRRDKEWRDFFIGIRATDSEAVKQMTNVIEKLVTRMESLENKFDAHDATEMEFLRGVAARDEPRTQPRKRAG